MNNTPINESDQRVYTEEKTDRKCPQCGSVISYDEGKHRLFCPSCGYEHQLSQVKGNEIEELDFDKAVHMASTDWGTKQVTVQCQSCGAKTVYDALVVSSVCPYCGSNQVMQNNDETAMAPFGICPFEVSEENAGGIFKKWIKKRYFAPFGFSKKAKANKLDSIYLPWWTYDSDTVSEFDANAGEDYTVSVPVTVSDGKGHTHTEMRTETRTRWYPVNGVYSEFIDDLPVNASKRIDDNMLSKILPFNFQMLQKYDPQLLAGIGAERYSIGLQEGWEKAKILIHDILNNSIKKYILRKWNADHVARLNFTTAFSKVKFRYVLLPLWISSYMYKGKTYQYMINGQTGKSYGKAPVSPIKIIGLIAIIAAIVIGLYFLFRNM